MAQQRFVILDRDGTINVERHYLSAPQQLELLPEAANGMRQLREMGLGLVVITNQSAIARGLLDRRQLDRIHERLRQLLRAENVHLDRIYTCPHRPEDQCLCRKPATALLELAAQELDFDPQSSFVIGDKACDIELGQRVGATTILVRTGYGAQTASQATLAPHYVVNDVREAAQIIKRLLCQDERKAPSAAQG